MRKRGKIGFFSAVKDALEFARHLRNSPGTVTTHFLEETRRYLPKVKTPLSRLDKVQRAALDLKVEQITESRQAALELKLRQLFDEGDAQQAPRGPQTMLGRVGVEGWLSDFLVDRFEVECDVILHALDELIASYEALPPDYNYNGPPREIQAVIPYLASAWWNAFGLKPAFTPNAAFGLVLNALLDALGEKRAGLKTLKRILEPLNKLG